MANKIWELLGVSDHFDPARQFVSSPLLQPRALAILRLTVAVYTFVTLLFKLIWDGVVNRSAQMFFSYFTELSYIGLCAYFWASGVQTAAYALNLRRLRQTSRSVGHASDEKSSADAVSYPLQKWPKIFQFLHTLLWSTVTTYPFLVTVVFWSLLSGPSTFETRFDAWANISIHILNSVFALFEIIFSSVGTQPWLHIVFLILILGGYLAIAYITHATQGFYTYSFLDPGKVGAFVAAYVVGILAVAAVIFAIVWAACFAKVKLVERSKE